MPPSDLSGKLEKKLAEIKKEEIESLAKETAAKNGLPYLRADITPIDLNALSLLSEEDSRAGQVAIIGRNQKNLRLVLVNPASTAADKIIKDLSFQGYSLEIFVVSADGLSFIWDKYQELPHQFKGQKTLGTVSINEESISSLQKEIKDISDLKEKISSLPISRLLEILVAGAIKVQASDIHIEPEENRVRVRYRLDGILSDITKITSAVYLKLLARIKITSGLKINIRHAPQDGRFSIKYGRQLIEIRTSSLPGAYGENMVMRILDPKTIKQNIEELGFTKEQIKIIKELLAKTTGSILTTGPTGSGKTTTLYAFVNSVNQPGSKIITIEDPVEYHIAGIAQTQVNPQKGYTFANGLRSIMRQDPDVILVGEIRDGETAEIAMQAALTGHLVFSTLHTNDAPGAIPRLLDLGSKAPTVSSALSAVIAQRLVRKLCLHCKVKAKIKAEDFKFIKEKLSVLSSSKENFPLPEEIFYPQQCAECNFTGYQGRLGVFEMFVVDQEMEKLILKTPPVSEVKELAIKKGMIPMMQDGILKVLEGKTSLEEVRRILE